jgi:hypothetical protein
MLKETKTEDTSVERLNDNFNIQLERKVVEGANIVNLQSIPSSYEDCNNDSMFEEELSESKEEVGDNPFWVLPTKNDQAKELSDHGMNHLVDDEAPTQMLNLVLHEEQ